MLPTVCELIKVLWAALLTRCGPANGNKGTLASLGNSNTSKTQLACVVPVFPDLY